MINMERKLNAESPPDEVRNFFQEQFKINSFVQLILHSLDTVIEICGKKFSQFFIVIMRWNVSEKRMCVIWWCKYSLKHPSQKVLEHFLDLCVRQGVFESRTENIRGTRAWLEAADHPDKSKLKGCLESFKKTKPQRMLFIRFLM